MPNTKTNVCKKCGVAKTKAEFRDPGETRGRCPANCYECRQKYPELQEHHLKNKAQRESARQRQEDLSLRSDEAILEYREWKHPDGTKRCPKTTDDGSTGCGKTLPLTEFGSNRHQYDGLTSVCKDCLVTYGKVA